MGIQPHSALSPSNTSLYIQTCLLKVVKLAARQARLLLAKAPRPSLVPPRPVSNSLSVVSTVSSARVTTPSVSVPVLPSTLLPSSSSWLVTLPATTRSPESFPVTCSSPSETTKSSTAFSATLSSPRVVSSPTSTPSSFPARPTPARVAPLPRRSKGTGNLRQALPHHHWVRPLNCSLGLLPLLGLSMLMHSRGLCNACSL